MSSFTVKATPKVLLFLKAPRPGFVKTRLAVDLGDQDACRIYRRLAEETLSIVPASWAKEVVFTPAEAEEEMKSWLGNGPDFRPQSDGNLGRRLQLASSEAFQSGAASVLLLGGDCPGITSAHLEEAAAVLARGEAVVGPAVDGGYWLLGLPSDLPQVFQNVPWSTSTVLTETLTRLQALDLPVHHLDLLEDVDDLSSLTRARTSYPHLFFSQNP
ncbi:TIGR04282 family arsenosugar biosynthesis glycosyltransferase [Verrucomicrobiaceae bacterium 227]